MAKRVSSCRRSRCKISVAKVETLFPAKSTEATAKLFHRNSFISCKDPHGIGLSARSIAMTAGGIAADSSIGGGAGACNSRGSGQSFISTRWNCMTCALASSIVFGREASSSGAIEVSTFTRRSLRVLTQRNNALTKSRSAIAVSAATPPTTPVLRPFSEEAK